MKSHATETMILQGLPVEESPEVFKTLESAPGVYDVVRVIHGAPLFLEDHLNRIRRSAELSVLSIQVPEHSVIEKSLSLLIGLLGPGTYSIKLIFMEGGKNCYAMARVPRRLPSQADYRQGVSTHLFHLSRNHPQIKEIDRHYSQTVQREIDEDRVFEVLLVDENLRITEGSKSNIFFIRGETLITPPAKEVLPGITRGKVLYLSRQGGLSVEEKDVFVSDLPNFDAAFLTGTSIFILPVARINDLSFPSADHPTIQKVTRAYAALTEEYLASYACHDNPD
ncbi:MAG: aminotransferase class IV [Spirochaetales bacterium]|nr:aminotransferase class IV [Spirochaetales bacterium]